MLKGMEVRLGKLTRREFRERMESGELQACIIPLAAVEQHLEHLYKHGIITKEDAITYANEASLIDRIAKLEAEAR